MGATWGACGFPEPACPGHQGAPRVASDRCLLGPSVPSSAQWSLVTRGSLVVKPGSGVDCETTEAGSGVRRLGGPVTVGQLLVVLSPAASLFISPAAPPGCPLLCFGKHLLNTNCVQGTGGRGCTRRVLALRLLSSLEMGTAAIYRVPPWTPRVPVGALQELSMTSAGGTPWGTPDLACRGASWRRHPLSCHVQDE